MPLIFRRTHAVAALLGVALATPAMAQMGFPGRQGSGFSFGPTLGLYIPTEDLIQSLSTGAKFKQEIGLTVGARLGLRFNRWIGIEGLATYSPTDLRRTITEQGQVVKSTTGANILSGSARAVLSLLPQTSILAFNLSGGVGAVRRSGEAYKDSDVKTDVGASLGASARIRLLGISLMANVDNYRYKPSASSSLPGIPFGSETTKRIAQSDYVLSIGVGFGR